MSRDDASPQVMTATRRPTDEHVRAAARSNGSRPGPRVLIRLPDLRPKSKGSGWKKWLAFFAAMLGWSSLAAAGHSGGKTSTSSSEPGDLSDPANVARIWSVYQRFRPLVHYVISHPKTVISGALAAAAQFAAMVAWHESGPPTVDPNLPAVTQAQPTTAGVPPATDPHEAPPWRPGPSHTAQRPFDQPGPALPPSNEAPGWNVPAPPHTPPQEDGERLPASYPSVNDRPAPPAQRADARGVGSERVSHAGANAPPVYERAPVYLSARAEVTEAETSTRTSGVAWLEGKIIPAPTRESQHEPQPSVH